MSARKLDDTILKVHMEPLLPLLARPDLRELCINEPGKIWVEDKAGWTTVDMPEFDYHSLSVLATAAAAYTGQEISSSRPICSTTLPAGERCQVVLPPAVAHGTVSFTIRKPGDVSLSLDQLDAYGYFSQVVTQEALSAAEAELIKLRDAGEWNEFFRLAVISKKNILISGATGSGKTTFSKALMQMVPLDERIITIEDARELEFPHQNKVHLVYSKDGGGAANVTAKGLLESSLRMRPDRIFLQELRDGTAFYYLRNVNSGHPGSITTVHANSCELAIEQLTLLVKESEGGRDLARDDIRALLLTLVDIIVQAEKVGRNFRVTQIRYRPEDRMKAA